MGVAPMASSLAARVYQESRREILSYVTRMTLRAEIAEEIVQQAALRLVEQDPAPGDAGGTRAWLFRVATNLALDHLRRHATKREHIILETRERAEADPAFLAEVALLRGSAETSAIAREHLMVCLACTLRNLPPEQAAALLLVEVYGFTVAEAAPMLEASFGQAKGWIQSARAAMREKYEATCALIGKQGVCHQCVELGEYFTGRPDSPLGGARDIDARLEILRAHGEHMPGPFHRLMLKIVNDLFAGDSAKER